MLELATPRDRTADHVHLLCRLGKTVDVSTLVRELKRESSKWIKKEFGDLAAFSWQEGYGAFSLSPAHVDAVKAYVANQMEHHRQESFQEEFRRICEKYGAAIDERYVWDQVTVKPFQGSVGGVGDRVPGCAEYRDPSLCCETPSAFQSAK